MSAKAGTALLTWGVASRALPGQNVSGDAFVVTPHQRGVLVGVIDGLGHGSAAAKASRTAVELLENHAGENLETLVLRCHQGLKATRGVVMTLASFDTTTSTMTWIGVGNVEGVLLSDAPPRSTRVVLRGGVVGARANLPTLHTSSIEVTGNDTLLLTTDGISNRFTNDLSVQQEPQHIADEIFGEFAKDSDDALMLVARWIGAT